MDAQRHLFQLPDNEHYLNCAYMSPLLRSAEEAGIRGLLRKRNPTHITPEDFFTEAEHARQLFARLIGGEAEQVALIPSVSYGMASIMQNLKPRPWQQAVMVADEFPSSYFALARWCVDTDSNLKIVEAPEYAPGRGQSWNERILAAIDENTGLVLMSHVHWMDGTRFDLKAIGQRCKEVGALLVVDGTQSVGALPLHVQEFQIDALICAGYKWLLGPYSLGLAYFSPYFNEGRPLEESWLNRQNARDFRRLTEYEAAYMPGAARYNMGEYSNFIELPMLIKALEQILDWQVEHIQAYCQKLVEPLCDYLQANGFWLEEEAYRASHLFGFKLAAAVSEEKLLQEFARQKIYVSLRGDALRVSLHLYNSKSDIKALIRALEACRISDKIKH